VGKTVNFRGTAVPVQELTKTAFAGIDLALFSAGGGISRDYAQAAVACGAVVVDNSSAFRMVPDVPLVVPEINPEDIKSHRGIIANPNCTTAISLMALNPLHRRFGLKRIFASTYQAVSGAGARAIHELRSQTEALAARKPIEKEVFPHQIAFNVIPQVDAFLDTGYTREEMKLENEGRKILHLPTFRASVTCVRVPVLNGHSEALHVELDGPLSAEEATEILRSAPGVKVVDDLGKGRYPMPLDVSGQDDVFVGRIREDSSVENGLVLFVAGDNIRKGAASNAIQIAEELIRREK
jgi:aspartate-semialdehyde dehydrogenase